MEYGLQTAEEARLAVNQANVDPETGVDYGPLPDNPVVDALRAAPRFMVDIGMAVGTGGSSLIAGTAARYTGKQVAKRSARVFAGLSGAQVFGRQYAESYDYYVNQEGYDPRDAFPVILSESLGAGGSTVLTSRIEGSFLFTSKAARVLRLQTCLPN